MNAPKTIKIDDVEYVQLGAQIKTGPRSIVRCRNAGVHVGEVVSRDANTLVLANANRMWRWQGANTLSEVSLHGVDRDEWTRIAETVPGITLTVSDVCEVIPVAEGVDLSPVWND